MRFYDSVDILAEDGVSVAHSNVPAVVGVIASSDAASIGTPYGSVTTLQAMVPAEWAGKVRVSHRVRWHGTVYGIPSEPVPRMRRDRIHHLTIPLKQASGV